MPRSHWLDPLARKVLQATGQLPPQPKQSRAQPSHERMKLEPQPPAWTLDVNRATPDQWRQLPGCTDDMADLLVRLQRGGVQFTAAEELFRLLELPPDLSVLWHPHLIFHWYGDAPPQLQTPALDLNTAAPIELQVLQWPDERLQRLLQARRREGFRDLADLQERLSLPPATVEALIGRVCFGDRRPGPSLPPRN